MQFPCVFAVYLFGLPFLCDARVKFDKAKEQLSDALDKLPGQLDQNRKDVMDKFPDMPDVGRQKSDKMPDMNPATCDQMLSMFEPSGDRTGGPQIPDHCFLSNKNLQVSTDQAAKLLKSLKDPRAIQNMFKSASGTHQQALDMMVKLKEQAGELSEAKMKAAVGPLIQSLGGAKNLQPQDIQNLGPDLVMKMPAEFIKKLPIGSFDAVVDEFFHGGKNISSEDILPTSEGMMMCQMAFRNYRNINTESKLNKILPLLPCAPVQVCKSIPAAIVENRLSDIAQLPWNCQPKADESKAKERLWQEFPQMVGCAKALVRKVSSDGSFDAAKFDSLGPMKNCMNKADLLGLVNSESCSNVIAMAEHIQLSQFAQVKKKLKFKCAPDSLRNNQLEQVTLAELKSMGSIATELSANIVKRINKTVLCDSEFIDMLKENSNAPERTRKVVAKRCFKDMTLTASDIKAMGTETLLELDVGKLKTSVTKADLDNDAEVKKNLKQALKSHKRDPRIRMLRKEMQAKFNVKDLVDSREIMKEMPLSRLKTEVTDIKHDLGLDDNATEPDLPDTMNKWGVKKMLQNKTPESMTADDLKGMRTLARGLLTGHIDRLNKTDMFSSAVVLCEHKNWPGKSVHAITEKLIIPALKKENPTDYMSTLTVTDVSVLGCECLMHFRPNDLKKTTAEVCAAVCQKIGSCDEVHCMSTKLRTKLKDVCLHCLGKDVSGTITEEDLDTLGHGLASEMSVEISRVDSTALNNRMSLFRRGCIHGDAQSRLMSKVKQALGEASSLDSSGVNQAGELVILYAKDGTLGDVSEDALAEAASEIFEDFNPTDESARRHQQCCTDGLSETERQEQRTLQKSVLTRLKSIMDTLASTGTRRKRSAATWTCDDITSMGPSITTATLTDIQAIGNTEFSDCLGTFGQYSDWSTEQRNALLEKVKTAVGAVCDLTSSDLVNLGSIALSLTTNDISCLQLTEDDPVAALGALSDWTSAQRSALASRFLSQHSLTVATLDGSHVSMLGHILCGTSTSLEGLTSAAFSEATAQVGQLTSCPVGHLQALKTVASRSDTFGAVTTWGADTLSELGVIVAGLSSSELQGLSNSSIEGIRTHGIKLIPPETLKAMTAAQLESFSVGQAQAVTTTQRNQLSTAQKNALLVAQYGEYADLSSAGSQPVGGILPVLLLLVTATVLHL